MIVFFCTQPLMAQSFTDVKPSPQQTAWQDLEIGVLIHFGPNTFMNREWGDGTAETSVFNPTQFDPEQWMRAAKSAGANYLVMVAKHHDGFCLWPSGQTDYGVKSSPWRGGRGDVVREVTTAARKNGLKVGLYLSPWDRHEPFYKDTKKYDDFYFAQLGGTCDALRRHQRNSGWTARAAKDTFTISTVTFRSCAFINRTRWCSPMRRC